MELIIHSIVFLILKKFNLLNGKICTIGDGKANFVTGLLFLNDNSIKIYSVNLPQALIQDYKIIKKFNLIKDKFIKVVDCEKDLDDKNINSNNLLTQQIQSLENKNNNLIQENTLLKSQIQSLEDKNTNLNNLILNMQDELNIIKR